MLVRYFFYLASILCLGVTTAEAADFAALISDTSNPYWKTLERGLSDTAQVLGIQIDIHSLQSATDAEGQLNQCETVLLTHPKVVIFAAVDAVNLRSCLLKANEQGITLIDIDGNIDEARAARMGIQVAFSVASNNYELGAKAAAYLNGRKGKVLVIEGLSASQPGILRIKGFRENLGEDLKIIASQPGNWDRMKAADIVTQVVTQYPDLFAIFAANDTMALGAVEALRAVHISNVVVVGIDGTVDAVKAIKEGRLTASIAQLPYLMAKEALEKAAAYIKNPQPLSFHQYVPIVALDRAVFERNQESLLRYVR